MVSSSAINSVSHYVQEVTDTVISESPIGSYNHASTIIEDVMNHICVVTETVISDSPMRVNPILLASR